MKVEKSEFGLGAALLKITNSKGYSISFTNFGARVVSLEVPTKQGRKNIIWGYDCVQDYLAHDPYPGATIGRFAGRIKNGQFKINGQIFQAMQNEGKNTLHGGFKSFEESLWFFETFATADKAEIIFTLNSKAGENGFPGQLAVKVMHTFDEAGHWTVHYEATSDQDTLFNPTNHVYFNLTGKMNQPVDGHLLTLRANEFAPLGNEGYPTGEKKSVLGTAFDFQKGKKLSAAFASQDEQILLKKGIDHPFFLIKPSLTENQACLEYDNLRLTVKTDRPALVIFTANFSATDLQKYEGKFALHSGITFEAQTAPGSAEFSDFGNPILRKGEKFDSTTIYKIAEVGEGKNDR